MSDGKRQQNPAAFLAIGTCFLGAGVAIGLPAMVAGNAIAGVGAGLMGLGAVFLITGLAQKRKAESAPGQDGDEDDRPPA